MCVQACLCVVTIHLTHWISNPLILEGKSINSTETITLDQLLIHDVKASTKQKGMLSQNSLQGALL